MDGKIYTMVTNQKKSGVVSHISFRQSKFQTMKIYQGYWKALHNYKSQFPNKTYTL